MLEKSDLQAIAELMDTKLTPITDRLDGIDERLDGIDERLDGVDERLDGMDRRLDGMDKRLDDMDERLDESVQELKGQISVLERSVGKLDKRISTLDEAVVLLDSKLTHNSTILENTVNKAIQAIAEGYQMNYDRFERFNPDDYQMRVKMLEAEVHLLRDKLSIYVR